MNAEFRNETRHVLYEAHKITKYYPTEQIYLDAFQNAGFIAYANHRNTIVKTKNVAVNDVRPL